MTDAQWIRHIAERGAILGGEADKLRAMAANLERITAALAGDETYVLCTVTEFNEAKQKAFDEGREAGVTEAENIALKLQELCDRQAIEIGRLREDRG